MPTLDVAERGENRERRRAAMLTLNLATAASENVLYAQKLIFVLYLQWNSSNILECLWFPYGTGCTRDNGPGIKEAKLRFVTKFCASPLAFKGASSWG